MGSGLAVVAALGDRQRGVAALGAVIDRGAVVEQQVDEVAAAVRDRTRAVLRALEIGLL